LARSFFKPVSGVFAALLLALATVSAVSYRNTITPHGIIIHHSAVTMTSDGRPVDVSALDEYHSRRGFGIFYWGLGLPRRLSLHHLP
jgi:hypothetical protein